MFARGLSLCSEYFPDTQLHRKAMTEKHHRGLFILTHVLVVCSVGAPLAFASNSTIPIFLLSLAPLVQVKNAEARERKTYLLSSLIAVLFACAALGGLLYLALGNYAEGWKHG
jgi:hypothetical protein